MPHMHDPTLRLTRLADDDGYLGPEPDDGEEHPMRVVTREVAFEAGWSPGRARKVAELFDGLAPGWDETRLTAERLAPIADALARGQLDLDGRWLELGSGTGVGTRVLAPACRWMAAVDLSAEMLANAPADLAPRVRADGSLLPFVDGAFDGVLLVNMLLFPAEVDRVLASGGRVVWINTAGERTPIHLSADELLDALPGPWTGVTARSGRGFWVSAGRASGG